MGNLNYAKTSDVSLSTTFKNSGPRTPKKFDSK